MIKIIKLCGRCKQYYTTDECIPCKDEYKTQILFFSNILCREFKFPNSEFLYFISKYFLDSYNDYKPIHPRRMPGTYFNIASSIFYVYVNMNHKFIIESSALRGLIQKMGFNHSNLTRYINRTIEIYDSKYGRFYPSRLKRQKKLERIIKSIMGKLRKPILGEQVISFIPIIGFDNPRMNPRTIAVQYIIFYYRIVRGWDINRKELSKASETSIRTLLNVYHGIFKKIAMKRIKHTLAPNKQLPDQII